MQPDRHQLKRLLWESAEGVIFADGTVRRKKLPALAYDIGNGLPIRGLGQQYMSDGGRWLWSAAGGRIDRWEFGAPEMIEAAFPGYIADATATDRPTIYDFTPYGNWMLVNSGNPTVPAKIHKKGTPDTWTDFAAGEAPVGVLLFTKLMSFLVAIGYGPRGTQVGWSDANNVELWTAAADNTAGSLSIDTFNTPIRAAGRIANAISVFSEDQMALVSYIGAPFIFGQQTILDGIGAIGKAAVANDTKINVGVGRAGCWWTDANSARYIDEGYLANYLQENVNWDQGAKIVVGRNDYTGTFEFHFPMRTSTSINEAWAWDPKTGGWSPVPFASMMDERRLFSYPVQGTNNGYVNLTDFLDDVLSPMSLVSKPLVMQTSESPHVVVRVDEVDILLHEANQIEFRLGCSDEPNGEYEWSLWQAATVGARLYQIDALPEAAFWKIEFRSVAGISDWTMDLQGFILYGVTTGTKM
jgi:hypothetical protein